MNASRLEKIWFGAERPNWWLRALTHIYGAAVVLRRKMYRRGWLRRTRLACPVIVVGNIAVGGSGKTPLVIWLAQWFAAKNLAVGVVSRGYGGRGRRHPIVVTAESDPLEVGDEPVLIAQRCGCPVVVDPQRPRGGKFLLERFAVDVLLCDDGLQHYALERDVEIAVIEGSRALGNGCLLPAGPLREPLSRLREVDLVVSKGPSHNYPLQYDLRTDFIRRVGHPDQSDSVSEWAGRRVHGVAGIGNPENFFAMLRSLGLTVVSHPFPDHWSFTERDLQFDDDAPIVMTEKDRVKCGGFSQPQWWFLPVDAVPNAAFVAAMELIYQRKILRRVPAS